MVPRQGDIGALFLRKDLTETRAEHPVEHDVEHPVEHDVEHPQERLDRNRRES